MNKKEFININTLFQFFQKQYLRDIVTVIIMVVLYNAYFSIIYDSFQYINVRKIIWAFVGGVLTFVPMYLILWGFLRKVGSKFLFFIVSLGIWVIYPLLLYPKRASTINLRQGGSQIYENGDLTLAGFIYNLQNPFFF
mgnify:CR=1 FL=1